MSANQPCSGVPIPLKNTAFFREADAPEDDKAIGNL
jgi:hypothetical protein